MKALSSWLTVAVFPTALLVADHSASHNVNVTVSESSSISVSSNTVNLTITDYSPGTDTPIGGNIASTTYAYTSNSNANRRINVEANASINTLPAEAKIAVSASLGQGYTQTTGNATTYTVNQITTTPQIIIGGLKKITIPEGSFTYTLTAPASAGPIGSVDIQITYTIANE